MSKKKENAAVTVYTLQRTKLSQTDVDNFNAQYPKLDVKYTRAFRVTKSSQIISTHILTVLTTCVILHAEQRKQHISPVGEIFLI